MCAAGPSTHHGPGRQVLLLLSSEPARTRRRIAYRACYDAPVMRAPILRGDRLRLCRVGPPRPVRQRDVRRGEDGRLLVSGRNPRAPERRGLWAFPSPLMDHFFTCYQTQLVTPRRLGDDAWRRIDDDYAGGLLSAGERARAHERLADERAAWYRGPGRRLLGVRHFWVSGSVYTHLGDHDGEWSLVGVRELGALIERQYARDLAHVRRRAREWSPDLPTSALIAPGRGQWPTSIDHLELFVGRAARIH